jgi:hypothetical protein
VSVGIFTDKAHRPATREVIKAVRPREAGWNELVQFVRDNFSRREELKFYGKNYGWAVRFCRKGKALVSLYPAGGGFAAQIILSDPDAKRALALRIGSHVRKVIAAAHPYPEGRWLFIPVKTKKDIQDIRALIALKSGTNPAQNKTGRSPRNFQKLKNNRRNTRTPRER